MKSPSIPQDLIDEYRTWLAAGHHRSVPNRADNREPVRMSWRDTWTSIPDDSYFDITGKHQARWRGRMMDAGLLQEKDGVGAR
jgi:hypothetical protein